MGGGWGVGDGSASRPADGISQLMRYRSKEGRHYQATTLQLMPCLPSLVIKPRPAFHCLQYGKAGEGLVYFLM